MGDRGKIVLINQRQKMALGVDNEEKILRTILDSLYVNFPSFKKGVLERISACGFLLSILYFHSNPYVRAQVAAAIATLSIWTLKMSSSTARYI